MKVLRQHQVAEDRAVLLEACPAEYQEGIRIMMG